MFPIFFFFIKNKKWSCCALPMSRRGRQSVGGLGLFISQNSMRWSTLASSSPKEANPPCCKCITTAELWSSCGCSWYVGRKKIKKYIYIPVYNIAKILCGFFFFIFLMFLQNSQRNLCFYSFYPTPGYHNI